MLEIKNVDDIKDDTILYYKQNKRNAPVYSDVIYTFDIEVSSLFNINSKWQRFNYDISDYTDIDKRSCVYICMLGIEDEVYYFRNFTFFEDVLKKISNQRARKIIYIHNLSYEFQFLRGIFKNYTIENMLATAPHKPISFLVKELNIEFRCSYRLTNLSLEKSAEKYTKVKKKVGDLDYNIERSPLTKLNDTELGYCEYDIITLYEIIKYFRNQYSHTANIPLTQTGEVRRELKKRIDYAHIRKIQCLIPDYITSCYLMQAFAGGITHANMIYSGKVLNNVFSSDESSAYPTMLLTKKYPCGKWYEYNIKDYEFFKNDKCFLFHVKLYGLKSKLYNHYISCYKCITASNMYKDNGRLVSADYVELIITDQDFEMIKLSYNIEKIEYIKILGCVKKYLPTKILQYILDLYKYKTELKGVAGKEDFYMKSKQQINSIFGCACTSIFNQDTVFKNGEWDKLIKDNESKRAFINAKLEEQKHSFSNIFLYSTGVWCTAYNRAALWANIALNDKYVVYYDTDSIKSLNNFNYSAYNNKIIAECLQSANENDLDIEAFKPKTIKGIEKQLGIFESEAVANKFCTLGAKKYCAEYDDGLHLTVSGVRKNAVVALKGDIHNFKKGLIFDYSAAQKNIHYYVDDQESFTFIDIDGNEYTCEDNYGIVLAPTTYKLGITEEYEDLIKYYEV